MSEAARRAVERAARTSYGRLLALLARRMGDIAAAEDALAEAFAAALAAWRDRGVPDEPDAWLMTAARRSAGRARARAATATAAADILLKLIEEREAAVTAFPDHRLHLLFACAHPAIERTVQAPLMLQTVLGLDAVRIAACFLVSPAAMGRALSRAKVKIRDARIPFALPDAAELAPRVAAVLDAVYAAHGTAWEDVAGVDGRRRGLAEEALWLGRMLVELLPDEPEAKGLLALMLYCRARCATRRDADGAFVPLNAQDPRHWVADDHLEAEALLRAAAVCRRPGRYQIESAIQSLHAQALMTGAELSQPLIGLYDLLVGHTPALGAAVARAAAYAEGGQTDAALAQLAALDARTYQPWWAVRARALHLKGDEAGAGEAAQHAAGLSVDPAIRDYLLSGGPFVARKGG